MTVKSSISLSDDQDAFARALIADGRFSSMSAILQHGLELIRTRTEMEMLEREALKRLIAERQSGDFVSGAAIKKQTAAMIARKRNADGV